MHRALEEPMRRAFLAELPKVTDDLSWTMFGRHIQDDPIVLVDGLAAVAALVTCALGGDLPTCDEEQIRVSLSEKPALGQHTFQLATPGGLVSNEIMIVSE